MIYKASPSVHQKEEVEAAAVAAAAREEKEAHVIGTGHEKSSSSSPRRRRQRSPQNPPLSISTHRLVVDWWVGFVTIIPYCRQA